MPAWIYLAALVLQSIVTVAVTVAVLVGMGVALYHLRLDAQSLVGLAVYTLIGTATMCAIGLALTRVATTADSASAIGPFSTVSLAFVSGVFIPVSQLPTWLAGHRSALSPGPPGQRAADGVHRASTPPV